MLSDKTKWMLAFTLLVASVCLVAYAASYTPVIAENDVTISGAYTFSGNVTQSGLQTFSPQTVTATEGLAITSTATYVQLVPSGAPSMTCTVANASAAGQLLIMSVVGATNVIINDTGNWEGAVTLGDEDTVIAISEATGQWIQLATKNNTP